MDDTPKNELDRAARSVAEARQAIMKMAVSMAPAFARLTAAINALDTRKPPV